MRGVSAKILLLLLVVACCACRPRGVLSNREMRNVLYDLHRVDGALQVAGYNYSHDQELAGYYKNVLDKHGVTQAEFDSSLVWFTDNPQIFNKIYPKVIERLDRDYEAEKLLREQRRDKRLADQQQKKRQKQDAKKAAEYLEEQIKRMIYGYENPWKEWRVEEFSEKNVIIFGQLEKK